MGIANEQNSTASNEEFLLLADVPFSEIKAR